MGYSKNIVCLANSRKTGGRCVAGREVTPGGYGPWIRPISHRPTAEVLSYERQYEDRSDPCVLHVIEVPLIEARPSHHQTENHLIDASQRWVKRGQRHWVDLEPLLETPPDLWRVGSHTSFGQNDRVLPEDLADCTYSLVLIQPDAVSIRVRGEWDGQPKVRGRVAYRGVEYLLSVTDPLAEETFKSKGLGEYPLADTYLCISLGEAHRDPTGRVYCYKFVAAVISRRPW